MNIQSAITELHNMFRKINEAKFGGTLPEPAILVQNQGKRKGILGWCTTEKIWSSPDGSIKKYEISMCAEHLARPVLELAETMLHEMVHLYDVVNGVKDCSRNNTWHNERFKVEAENRGMECLKHERYGWAVTKLSDATREQFDRLGFNQGAFVIERHVEGKAGGEGKAAAKSLKYMCPQCHASVRATKIVNIACLDCEVPMELQEMAEDQEGNEDQ